MSRHHYGPLYLIQRERSNGPEARHEAVVGRYEDGRSHIDVTKELWSLADNDVRVSEIVAIVDRAADGDEPVLLAADIEDMLKLINDAELETALKQTVIDEHLNIRPDRMADVRHRTRLLDVGEERGDLAYGAVWEGLTRVWALRNILEEARTRKLDIAFD